MPGTSVADRRATDAANSGTHSIAAERGDEHSQRDRANAQDTSRIGAKPRAGFPKRSDFGSQDDYIAAIKKFNARKAGQLEALK